MTLSFNSYGNLHKDVELSVEEFQKHFGTNSERIEKIKTALIFFKIFSQCGCMTVYIGGSFISTKKNPSDIDLCFDLNNINYERIRKEFPEFFDSNKIGTIRRDTKCHIFSFTDDNTAMLYYLKSDRNHNPKGLVKINLKEENIL